MFALIENRNPDGGRDFKVVEIVDSYAVVAKHERSGNRVLKDAAGATHGFAGLVERNLSGAGGYLRCFDTKALAGKWAGLQEAQDQLRAAQRALAASQEALAVEPDFSRAYRSNKPGPFQGTHARRQEARAFIESGAAETLTLIDG
jgi:hypothetical protein